MNFIDPTGLASCEAATGGNFPGVLELPDQACPQRSPPDPPKVPPSFGKKLKISNDSPYNPINSGTINNAGGEIDLAAMTRVGPTGPNYHGITVFDALDCAAQNNPRDSACWGVGVKLTVNGFQATWSDDAYANARDNYFEVWEVGGNIAGFPHAPKKNGYILRGGPLKDPLEPIKLAEPNFPMTLPSPTAQTYSCEGFQLWIHANPSALLGPQPAYRLNCH